MEAEVVAVHDMFEGRVIQGLLVAIEVRILRVSIHEELRLEGHRNRIDADNWKPLIMMFCDFYGLKDGKVKHSRLAEIEEEKYRGLTETTGEVEDQIDDDAEHLVGGLHHRSRQEELLRVDLDRHLAMTSDVIWADVSE